MTSVDLPEPLTPVTAISMPSGNCDVDVLQVVLARALDDDRAAARRTPRRSGSRSTLSRRRYAPVSEPLPSASRCRRLALEDDVAAVLARARPEIDHVVGRADRFLVVLDDHHGVAEVAQPAERRQQRPIVALMQPDRRLVEHVEHAGEVRADLRRQPDALAFAAGQRRRAPSEREIPDADVVQEPQAIADLAEDPARRSALRAR